MSRTRWYGVRRPPETDPGGLNTVVSLPEFPVVVLDMQNKGLYTVYQMSAVKPERWDSDNVVFSIRRISQQLPIRQGAKREHGSKYCQA